MRVVFIAASIGLLMAGCCKQGNSRTDDGSTGAPATATTAPLPGVGPVAASPGVTGALAKSASVLFLHHSTGENIWNGGVAQAIAEHNTRAGTSYRIEELAYPHDPYPWDNYPYDYWNLWVAHAGPQPFNGQETLEMLTGRAQVIVFKHCYPVSGIEPDSGRGDVSSSQKTLANYKLQYEALKAKMRAFRSTRFIVWTGAALTRGSMRGDYGGDDAMADRAKSFFAWVKGTWDERGDNIFVFDFYALETDGGRYMVDGNAVGASDSHPNEAFSRRVAPVFAKRVVDVIEGRGDG